MAFAVEINGHKVSGTGMPGKSAYQSAVDGGYIGTEEQFNMALSKFEDKANKAQNPVEGNIAILDSVGDLIDSGKNLSDISTEGKHITDDSTGEQYTIGIDNGQLYYIISNGGVK